MYSTHGIMAWSKKKCPKEVALLCGGQGPSGLRLVGGQRNVTISLSLNRPGKFLRESHPKSTKTHHKKKDIQKSWGPKKSRYLARKGNTLRNYSEISWKHWHLFGTTRKTGQ